MNKVVEMKPKENQHINDLINAVTTQKRTFIAPKQKMKEGIENDAKYLMALGGFIQEGEKRMNELMSKNNFFEASALNVQIMEAIGKYQANEGLVKDKQMHYEKVFLPMYEKEMAESKEKFDEMFANAKAIIESEPKNDDGKKIREYLIKEVGEYESSDIKDNEEYRNYMYKIFKRLVNKQEEIIATK
jgi:hypothetical protein